MVKIKNSTCFGFNPSLMDPCLFLVTVFEDPRFPSQKNSVPTLETLVKSQILIPEMRLFRVLFGFPTFLLAFLSLPPFGNVNELAVLVQPPVAAGISSVSMPWLWLVMPSPRAPWASRPDPPSW